MSKPVNLGISERNGEFYWVAVAFSQDTKLGDDLILPCSDAPNAKEVNT